MNKQVNIWTRKFHRWMAVPTALLIPIVVILKFSGNPTWLAFLKRYEMIQSLLMLSLAITGAYLFLLPYLSKWRRNKKQAA